MLRKLLFTLLSISALVAIGPAVAQLPAPAAPPPAPTIPQMRIVRSILPPAATVQSDSHAGTMQPWMTPETAKAAIEKLQADRRKLREQYQLTLSEYQKTLAKLDEMTRVGGSSVTAHCEGLISVSNAGGGENCGASGYACNAVSGLCERSCHEDSGDKCAPGYLCDGSDHCSLPPAAS